MRVYFPVCFTPKNITPCRTKNYIVFTRLDVFERGEVGNAMCHVLIVVNRQLDEFSRNNFCAQIIYDNIVIGTHERILSFVRFTIRYIAYRWIVYHNWKLKRKFAGNEYCCELSVNFARLRHGKLCVRPGMCYTACTSFATKIRTKTICRSMKSAWSD